MNIYYFSVFFENGFIAYYTIPAPNSDIAFAVMKMYADCDASEADTEIFDYNLEYVE